MSRIFTELTPDHKEILWEMLRLAAHEDDLAVVQANPDLARYVAGWGREGDFGWAAFQGDECLGAAWCRVWSADDAGYGFVDEMTPELGVAVVEEWRGRGLGQRLIEATLETARENYDAVSLSVRLGNPVERLYRRLGFEILPGSERTNRVGGTSATMVCRFR